ncbi:alpha-glucan family phosphorylase [Methanococcus voltae]|nr:alpha-glucan family phosphorylase [Methanococcus voltae]MCS3901448.1 starch phosphorylase [Methanococcus voltae]
MTKKEETSKIAYFSMEFAIDQALKTYAGGLGFLAGSLFKAAKRANYPMVGVSILWSYGYYDQMRDIEGRMVINKTRKFHDYLIDIDVKVPLNINRSKLWVKAYLLPEGIFSTCPIYYLTTDIPENDYLSRTISYNLYDGNNLTHIAQEMVLGIAGYEVLKKCENIDVYHLNEAQAIPLAFRMMEDKGFDYVKNHLVFTTHTPIPAGNEIQDINILDNMGFFSNVDIKTAEEFGGKPFNLTVAALKMSKKANAVSKLHQKTTQEMWSWVPGKCNITYITNAQDVNSWQDKKLRTYAEDGDFENLRKRKLHLKRQLFQVVGDQCGRLFDDKKLTVVWARRFAEYKRPYFPLHDEEKLKELIDSEKLQFIWAGKPHPADFNAQVTFNWIISKSREIKDTAVLTGYELHLSKLLKLGSDIWLNTPKRPNEASGTSGMTASMNGSVHMSTLDGWHVEWYNTYPELSFTIGDGENLNEDYEADSMYKLLWDVIDMYDTDKWWELVQKNILTSVDFFNSDRMLEEYSKKVYAEVDKKYEISNYNNIDNNDNNTANNDNNN